MWGVILTAVAVISLIALLTLGLLFWRLRAVGSRVGSFECALLVGNRWRAGIATYSRNHLHWHQVLSLAIAPSRRFDRDELQIVARDKPSAATGAAEISEARCRYHGAEVRLAADDGALDGLVSWLEASPPQPNRRIR